MLAYSRQGSGATCFRGEMTGKIGSTCTITLTLDDGGVREAVAQLQPGECPGDKYKYTKVNFFPQGIDTN
jgi:hypothetical protein